MAFFAAIAAPVVGGLVSSLLSPSGQQQSAAPAAADPFAAQRPQYQTQLNDMMKPGAQFNAQDPSYKWRLDQGAGAMAAQQAATGGGVSGRAMLDAQTYGQGMASQEYQNQFTRLSKLAGVDAGSPAAAGQILQQQNQNQQQAATATGGMVGGLVRDWLNPKPVDVQPANATVTYQ
jgi:hypothetical protein